MTSDCCGADDPPFVGAPRSSLAGRLETDKGVTGRPSSVVGASQKRWFEVLDLCQTKDASNKGDICFWIPRDRSTWFAFLMII
jgi:hypothetical protein